MLSVNRILAANYSASVNTANMQTYPASKLKSPNDSVSFTAGRYKYTPEIAEGIETSVSSLEKFFSQLPKSWFGLPKNDFGVPLGQSYLSIDGKEFLNDSKYIIKRVKHLTGEVKYVISQEVFGYHYNPEGIKTGRYAELTQITLFQPNKKHLLHFFQNKSHNSFSIWGRRVDKLTRIGFRPVVNEFEPRGIEQSDIDFVIKVLKAAKMHAQQ